MEIAVFCLLVALGAILAGVGRVRRESSLTIVGTALCVSAFVIVVVSGKQFPPIIGVLLALVSVPFGVAVARLRNRSRHV